MCLHHLLGVTLPAITPRYDGVFIGGGPKINLKLVGYSMRRQPADAMSFFSYNALAHRTGVEIARFFFFLRLFVCICVLCQSLNVALRV